MKFFQADPLRPVQAVTSRCKKGQPVCTDELSFYPLFIDLCAESQIHFAVFQLFNETCPDLLTVLELNFQPVRLGLVPDHKICRELCQRLKACKNNGPDIRVDVFLQGRHPGLQRIQCLLHIWMKDLAVFRQLDISSLPFEQFRPDLQFQFFDGVA